MSARGKLVGQVALAVRWMLPFLQATNPVEALATGWGSRQGNGLSIGEPPVPPVPLPPDPVVDVVVVVDVAATVVPPPAPVLVEPEVLVALEVPARPAPEAPVAGSVVVLPPQAETAALGATPRAAKNRVVQYSDRRRARMVSPTSTFRAAWPQCPNPR